MTSTPAAIPGYARAAVFGASGGIGAALVAALRERHPGCRVYAGSRRSQQQVDPQVTPFAFDLRDPASIGAAATAIGREGPFDLVLVATGMLTRPDGSGPEKSYRAITAQGLAEQFAINAVGPALVAQAMLPLLARDRRAVFAVLSARVGSIGDNRLGGWHGYRAAKAALNMLVRNFAIEIGRSHPDAIVAGLHPGTVASRLSEPFQRGVPSAKLFTPAVAAGHLLNLVASLAPEDSGGLFAWDGTAIPF
ncbi:SDR family NAD(P)-dependent oxidoreductase [Novosphingobium sp. Gsoil 351]|uniref:SDR family NAD(P)-dependent oxidoreductase n=1 Tax=Novosphingobium sp. Gsoil 351 TaxID=2675225 RepID=UPI0012B4EE90|nr:SDR family NAD(P)-dependent oxidoreductase [Novosphingobium sp. Gsoil 351]QGN53835.1 SDR family NAD(P)-dependent oxidoreductase [Novosphingobium sp. Gsoil 351]